MQHVVQRIFTTVDNVGWPSLSELDAVDIECPSLSEWIIGCIIVQ